MEIFLRGSWAISVSDSSWLMVTNIVRYSLTAHVADTHWIEIHSSFILHWLAIKLTLLEPSESIIPNDSEALFLE